MTHWLVVEADFHREYGISDLWATLWSVSWRWFATRVAGLSTGSRFVAALAEERSTVADPVKGASVIDAALGV